MDFVPPPKLLPLHEIDFNRSRAWQLAPTNGQPIYIDSAVCGAIELYLDRSGVRYVIRQDDEPDGILQMALDIDMPCLKDRYCVDAIEYEEIVGRQPRLQIRYSDDHLIGYALLNRNKL